MPRKANVYACTKHAEMALVNLDQCHILAISKLPDNNRCEIFKNKSYDEIMEILILYRAFIIKTINEKFGCGIVTITKSSNDNKIGADLICVCNGNVINVEVKFGNETSSAIGMKVFSDIFETTLFTTMLDLRHVRRLWHRMFINEGYNEELQLARLYSAQIDYGKQFNEQFAGKILGNDTVDFIEQNIINNSGSSAYKCENYLKFGIVDDEFAIIDFQYFRGRKWTIMPINIDDEKRINVRIESDANEVVTFILNWKNNYNLRGHGKFASKLGLGSPSWNVTFKRNDNE